VTATDISLGEVMSISRQAIEWQRKCQAYHTAIEHAREMGLQIPTVIQLADAVNFPEER